MAITVKSVSEMFNKDVFTERGVFVGKVVDIEVDLSKFRLRALIVEAARGSFLANMVGGRKGVIIPYQFVQSVGDVVIMKHITAPALPEDKTPEFESA